MSNGRVKKGSNETDSLSFTPGCDKADLNWPQNISDKGDCLNSVCLIKKYYKINLI